MLKFFIVVLSSLIFIIPAYSQTLERQRPNCGPWTCETCHSFVPKTPMKSYGRIEQQDHETSGHGYGRLRKNASPQGYIKPYLGCPWGSRDSNCYRCH